MNYHSSEKGGKRRIIYWKSCEFFKPEVEKNPHIWQKSLKWPKYIYSLKISLAGEHTFLQHDKTTASIYRLKQMKYSHCSSRNVQKHHSPNYVVNLVGSLNLHVFPSICICLVEGHMVTLFTSFVTVLTPTLLLHLKLSCCEIL